MGTIIKRVNPSGTVVYRAQIKINRKNLPAYSESKTFAKKAVATDWLRAREAELLANPELLETNRQQRASKPRKAGFPTLREAIKRYSEELSTEYSKSKFRTLSYTLNFDIADTRINQLRRSDFTEFAFTRQKGIPEMGIVPVGPATINGDLQYIRSVLKHAHFVWGLEIDWSELDLAIMGLRRARVIGKAQKRDRLATREELLDLTSYFYKQWQRPDSIKRVPMHLFMWFAIYSTRRMGEIGRLRWEDLDVRSRQWLVRDVKHPSGSKGNHKKFDVRDDLWEIIQIIRSDEVQARMHPKDSGLLLGGYSAKTLGSLFAQACDALMIEDLRWHDFRHEGVTRLAEDGLSIPLMQLVSLHGDWESMRVYTNLRKRPARLEFADAMRIAEQALQLDR